MRAALVEADIHGAPGQIAPDDLPYWSVYKKHLARALEAAERRGAERTREAAAKTADGLATIGGSPYSDAWKRSAEDIADAIRALPLD